MNYPATVPPRRIEEASLNAWPALHQLLLDGWLLRFSGGFTKRANSIVPLYAAELSLEPKVRQCEKLYARERLQTIFRLTSIGIEPGLDAYLEGRGYHHADPTDVLLAPLESATGHTGPAIRLVSRDRWLEAYAALTGMPPAAQRLHAAILRGIRSDCAFALLERDGGPIACGLGVAEEKLLGLFDVFTHPQARGRGFGIALVSQIMAWGHAQGAAHCYLQVTAENAPAKRLYERLGFCESYRYWYRISG